MAQIRDIPRNPGRVATLIGLRIIHKAEKCDVVVRWLAFIGLTLIALGTGGIKPCVSAFGGDQFSAEQVAIDSYFYCRKFSSPGTYVASSVSKFKVLYILQHMFAQESCVEVGLSLDVERSSCVERDSQTTHTAKGKLRHSM